MEDFLMTQEPQFSGGLQNTMMADQNESTLSYSLNAVLGEQDEMVDIKRNIARVKDAERKRIKRENESEEERAVRLEKDRRSKAQKLADLRLRRAENNEKRTARLAADAERKRQLRQTEDPEARAARLERMRLAMRKKREGMTSEQKAAKNRRDKELRISRMKESVPSSSSSVQDEAFHKEVSYRMVQLVLNGQSMIDDCCDICKAGLVEDREGVRRCVTCELIAERAIDPPKEDQNEDTNMSERVKLDEPDSALLAAKVKEVVLQTLEWAVGELSTTSEMASANQTFLSIITKSAEDIKSQIS